MVPRLTRYAFLELTSNGLVLKDDHGWADTLEVGYIIGPGRDVLGDSVTLLELDHPVDFADRFALIRREPRSVDDPARWTLR